MGAIRLLWRLGGGLSFVPEFRVVYESWTTKPIKQLALLYNDLVKDLISNNFWNRIDRLHVYDIHTNNNGEANVNWKNTSKSILPLNNPTWQAGLGYTGASNKGLNLNYIPSVDGQNYALNSSTIFTYRNSTVTGVNSDFGVYDGSVYCTLNTNGTSEYLRVNDGTPNSTSVSASGTVAGFATATRINSTSKSKYINGSKTTYSINSISLPTKTIYELGFNDNGVLTGTAAAISHPFLLIMDGVNDTEEAQLRNIFQKYLDAKTLFF